MLEFRFTLSKLRLHSSRSCLTVYGTCDALGFTPCAP